MAYEDGSVLVSRKEVCRARDSQNWLTRVKSSALGLYTDGQSESRDSLLVFVPHQCPHGIVRIIKEPWRA